MCPSRTQTSASFLLKHLYPNVNPIRFHVPVCRSMSRSMPNVSPMPNNLLYRKQA